MPICWSYRTVYDRDDHEERKAKENYEAPSAHEQNQVPQKSSAKSSQLWQKMVTILNDGPKSPGEWWIYELLKWGRRDPDAVQMKFDISAL